MKYITKVLIALISLSFFAHTIYADENTKNVEVVYNEPAIVTFICDNASTSIKVYQGELINEPPHYLIDGYIFAGWYDGEYKWNFENDVVMDNLTLVAKYNHISGSVYNITDPSTNGLNGMLDINAESIPLTNKDIIDLEEGYSMNIELKIDILDSENIEDNEKIILQEEARKSNHNIINYFKTDLLKSINNRTEHILQTNDEYKITIQIPESQRATNREYSIIEILDGNAKTLYIGRPQDNWLLEFETKNMATYVLTYRVLPEHKDVDEYEIPHTGVDGGIVIASGTNNTKNTNNTIVVLLMSIIILNLATLSALIMYMIKQNRLINEHIGDKEIHKKRGR